MYDVLNWIQRNHTNLLPLAQRLFTAVNGGPLTPNRQGREAQIMAKEFEVFNELKMMVEGEHIDWVRKRPGLRRDLTIYPEILTPEQRQQLDQIEQELLQMANEATEEPST